MNTRRQASKEVHFQEQQNHVKVGFNVIGKGVGGHSEMAKPGSIIFLVFHMLPGLVEGEVLVGQVKPIQDYLK